jgi:hypothetical protein
VCDWEPTKLINYHTLVWRIHYSALCWNCASTLFVAKVGGLQERTNANTDVEAQTLVYKRGCNTSRDAWSASNQITSASASIIADIVVKLKSCGVRSPVSSPQQRTNWWDSQSWKFSTVFQHWDWRRRHENLVCQSADCWEYCFKPAKVVKRDSSIHCAQSTQT